MSQSLPPSLTDRFEPDRVLGAGAFGTVWLARDRSLEREVAVKLLSPEHAASPEWRERFHREAELAARIDSPHVAAVFDFGIDGGVPYIVFQFLEGPNLREALREAGGRLPLDEALGRSRDVHAGLAAAHGEGILHRDLKAANVLLHARGHAVITDFGLAREHQGPGMTRTGMVMGTVPAMAPEQMTGEKPGPSWDLYAAALLLFELATGRNPFDAGTFVEVLERKRAGLRTGLREEGVPAPAALDRALRRALHPDPAERFGSAEEQWTALEEAGRAATSPAVDRRAATHVMERTVPASPPAGTDPTPRAGLGRRLTLSAGAGALLLAALLALRGSPPSAPRPEATAPAEVPWPYPETPEEVASALAEDLGGPDRAYRTYLDSSKGLDPAPRPEGLVPMGFHVFRRGFPPTHRPLYPASRAALERARALAGELDRSPPAPAVALRWLARAFAPLLVADHMFEVFGLPERSGIQEELLPWFQWGAGTSLPVTFRQGPLREAVVELLGRHARPPGPLVVDLHELSLRRGEPPGYRMKIRDPIRAAVEAKTRSAFAFANTVLEEASKRTEASFRLDPALLAGARAPGHGLLIAPLPFTTMRNLRLDLELAGALEGPSSHRTLPLPFGTNDTELLGAEHLESNPEEIDTLSRPDLPHRDYRGRVMTWAWISGRALPEGVGSLKLRAVRSFPGDYYENLNLDTVILAATPAPPLRDAPRVPALSADATPDPDVLSMGLTDTHLEQLREVAGGLGFHSRPVEEIERTAGALTVRVGPLPKGPQEVLLVTRSLPEAATLNAVRGDATREVWAGPRLPPGALDLEWAETCDDGPPAGLRRLVLGGEGPAELAIVALRGDTTDTQVVEVLTRPLRKDVPLARWSPPLIPSGVHGADQGPWGKAFPDWPRCR